MSIVVMVKTQHEQQGKPFGNATSVAFLPFQ